MRLNITPEPALLGFLLDGPMHGYDLYKQVNAAFGLVWHIGMSQMYAIVKTYTTRGWIQSEIQPQELRPSKKILAITPAGRQAFDEWLHQPAHGLREFRVDFFLRLYFARVLGAAAVRNLVEQQTANVERELADLKEYRRQSADDSEIFLLTRDFRIQQLATILHWLQANREALFRLGRPQPESDIRKPASTRQSSPRRKK